MIDFAVNLPCYLGIIQGQKQGIAKLVSNRDLRNRIAAV
ncbi:hypothetical protein Q7O_001569 [Pectobacterium carotovorum subsp. carotovorum PCCS1]|nr:hypothetical protein [Pectobacterium carotovorum subsp. carotovorum PCCS1]